MTAEEIAGLPARPPSIAEWEDLLVRLEIMPRALAGTLEGVDPEPGVREIVRGLVERERWAGRWLEAVAVGVREDAVGSPAASRADDLRWLADRFASLRARSFAMVQRRGVEVWAWEGELADGARASVYQVLTALLRSDGAGLAALRATTLGPIGVRAC